MWSAVFHADLLSNIVSFLNPLSREMVHLKLCNSVVQQMMERSVPLHHFVSILQSIATKQVYPPFIIPTHFILTSKMVSAIASNPNGCDSVHFLKRKYEEQFVYHLITKFILHYHDHPFCFQLLAHFEVNYQFLFTIASSMSEKSPVMSLLHSWSRTFDMMCAAKSEPVTQLQYNSFAVKEEWLQETEWKNLLWRKKEHHYRLYRTWHYFINQIPLELIDQIVEHRELVLVLILQLYIPFFSPHMLGTSKMWQILKKDTAIQFALLHKYKDSIPEQMCSFFSSQFEWNLLQDENMVMQLVQTNGLALQFLAEKWKNNPNIVKAAVRKHGDALFFAHSNLQQDKQIILEAARSKHICGEQCAPILEQFMKDREFLKELLATNGEFLTMLSEEILEDTELKMIAVTSHPFLIEEVQMKEEDFETMDRETLFSILKRAPSMSQGLPQHLCNDDEVRKFLIQLDGDEIINSKFINDRDMVFTALQTSGTALSATPFNRDEELILEAMRGYANNFSYLVPTSLQQDRTFAQKLVKTNGAVYYKLSESFQQDREIALMAVQQNPKIANHEKFPQQFKQDEQFKDAIRSFYGARIQRCKNSTTVMNK